MNSNEKKDMIMEGSLKEYYGREAVAIGVALLAFISVSIAMKQGTMESSRLVVGSTTSGCGFPAIFNFGDSNSDTGAFSATFHRIPPPHGRTFFGKPAARLSDGRLIIDFIGNTL